MARVRPPRTEPIPISRAKQTAREPAATTAPGVKRPATGGRSPAAKPGVAAAPHRNAAQGCSHVRAQPHHRQSYPAATYSEHGSDQMQSARGRRPNPEHLPQALRQVHVLVRELQRQICHLDLAKEARRLSEEAGVNNGTAQPLQDTFAGSYPKSVISVQWAAAAGHSSDRWRR